MDHPRTETHLFVPVATDFSEKLITAAKLDPDVPRSQEFENKDEYWTTCDPRKLTTYRVSLEDPKAIPLAALFKHVLPATNPDATRLPKEEVDNAVKALNIIFSYQSYPGCFIRDFERNPAVLPRWTTDNGQKFYGVAEWPNAPPDIRRSTATGDVFGRQGGILAIPGFWRSVRTTSSSEDRVDLTINTSTGCFWSHGTVQDLIDAWKRGAPDDLRNSVDAVEKFIRRAPIRLQHRHERLDPFMTVKGFAKSRYSHWTPFLGNCDMLFEKPESLLKKSVSAYYREKHDENLGPEVYAIRVGKARDNGLITVPATLLHVLPGKINPFQRPHNRSHRAPDVNYEMIINTGKGVFYSETPGWQGSGRL